MWQKVVSFKAAPSCVTSSNFQEPPSKHSQGLYYLMLMSEKLFSVHFCASNCLLTRGIYEKVMPFVVFCNTFNAYRVLTPPHSRSFFFIFHLFRAFYLSFSWILGDFSAVGLLQRPARSLPAKLVSEHVVRKGCVSEKQRRANERRDPASTVALVYYRSGTLIGWKVGKSGFMLRSGA